MPKFLLGSVFIIFNCLLNAQEGHTEDPHYVLFDGNEVAVCEDGIYVSTNKGMMKLNVVEYDRVNNQYKVQCSCLQRPWAGPSEALGVPYNGDSE